MAIDFALIGVRMQATRKQQKMTQEHMAERLQVSVGYISQIERGITRPNLEMLSEICICLDCELTYLLTGTVRGDRDYRKDEYAEQFDRLTDKERNVVLDVMYSLAKNRV